MSNELNTHLSLSEIQANALKVKDHIFHTPTIRLSSTKIKKYLCGAEIFLKLECLQHTGTFKARGALSVAMRIPQENKKNGVTAASAGNHAIAAAWAANQLGLSAKVVMQSTANPFRISMAQREGAEAILKAPGKPTFDEAERLVIEESRTFIHPFEGKYTSLGTSGVGLEMMLDVSDLDCVVVSVGGGGLISGIASAVKALNPKCKVYGVEPEGANSMSLSLAKGKPVTLESVNTIADSLGPPMSLPYGFSLCASHVDEIVLVTDDQICAGMVVLLEEAKLAVEPAAGASMAGILFPLKDKLLGKKVGLVVCGANIDAKSYKDFITRGSDFLKITDY